MTDKIRWGILGTGNIAHSFTRGLIGVEGAELIAVGSRAQSSADAFGDEFDIPHRYASYEALANASDIDVVYIATPHPFHKENSLLCINAGKAVLCEKPLTINAQETQTLIDSARENNVFLMEGMWTRFMPVMARIRELVNDGTLGDINLVNAEFGSQNAFDPTHRLFDPELGGGALLDVGIYPVSLAFMIMGTPESIESHAYIGQSGVDELGALMFKYPQGKSALLSCAITTRMRGEAVICGTKGMIKLPLEWWKAESFTLLLQEQEAQTIHLPFDHNGYEYEAMEVNRCLREGKTESDIMPLDESLAIMQTLDQIRAQWGLRYPME